MSEETVKYEVAKYDYELPDRATTQRQLAMVREFQTLVRSTLIEGHDYGVIPGTQKPTLLKPGAEKITKLLGLSDRYIVETQIEDWGKPLFAYTVRCSLVSLRSDQVVCEGIGHCNTMEGRYRWRWLSERDLPAGVNKANLVSQERHSRTGGKWTVYRFENDDVFTLVNTVLKMAKKRALVDAALSAGRLSDLFTQDMEDIGSPPETATPTRQPSKAPRAKTPAPPPEKSGDEEPPPLPPDEEIIIDNSPPRAAHDWRIPETMMSQADFITWCKSNSMAQGDVVRALGKPAGQWIAETGAADYRAAAAECVKAWTEEPVVEG